ncbi:MAG: alpha-galactosidase [Clostridia bacterium]|nr:alpha-galactosidase [Clostridia bacterium]
MQKALFHNDFTDIYVSTAAGGQPVFCYRTGMTVYEETFDKGRLVSAGWNTAGTPLDVLEGMPCRLDYDRFTRPWVFDVEVNGECVAYDWDYAGFAKQEETVPANGAKLLHGVVTLKNRRYPLTAYVHTVLSGSAVFTRCVTFANHSDAPMKLGGIVPMGGGLEIFYDWVNFVHGEGEKEKLYSLGYMENSHACAEGLFRWHDLSSGGTSFSGRFGADRHRYPMFMLKNAPLGRIWFAQLAFSGGYEFRFDLDADLSPNGISEGSGAAAKLSFQMALDAPAPQLVLAPGERFTTPEVYIGCVQGDLDDAVNMMHTHTRRAVFTHNEPKENVATVGAGIGPERAMTNEAIFHTIDTAAAVGAESCIVDAGWYCPAGEEGSAWWSRVGDWTPDPGKHADLFSAVRRRCLENGLKFGLWMECERMGRDTPVAKAHPDWYQTRRLRGADTTVIDMANPEAAAWVESEICRVIDTYGVELFRLDYNVDYTAYNCMTDRGGVAESSFLRYCNAVYAMFARLREKYPHVIFENCAGGGGRCDLGMARHFNHTWVTDYQIAPRSFAVTNGISMVLPPERIDRLVSGMNGHLRASLDFAVRAALFGKPTTNTYNPNGSAMNPQELAFVKRSFTLYKEFIRPYLTDGYVFHHTPELYEIHPKGRGIIERASKDGTKGIVGIFNLADVSDADDTVTVYPRGLDVGKTYEVTFDNTETKCAVSGFALVNEGLRVRLPASLTSELIVYKAV